MKRKSDYSEGGFRFRYVDGDYDYAIHKSVRYKRTKKNLKRAMWYKETYEHDYTYGDYDCTGSTRVRIKIKLGKDYILVYRYWSMDV